MLIKLTTAVMIILITAVLTGCSRTPTELTANITSQLKENAQAHGIPGQAVLIMHNQEVVYRNSLGISDIENAVPVNNKSIFPIYSVTKLFVSTLIMKLYETEQLKLSDPVSKYVPSLPTAWHDIRVEQFLNHSSGIPEYYRYKNGKYNFPTSIEKVFERLKDEPLIFNPDAEIRYNQTNYLVLKAVLEAITETPYRELVEQQLIIPLGLKDTSFGRKNVPKSRLVSAYYPESGKQFIKNKTHFPDYAISHSDTYSTVDDLSKFLSALAQGKLVSKQLLTELWQPYRLSDGSAGYFATGWDYDSFVNWHKIGHDGGSIVRVRILFKESLDDHYIIVYLTNGNRDGVWSRSLVNSVQNYVLPGFFSKVSKLLH